MACKGKSKSKGKGKRNAADSDGRGIFPGFSLYPKGGPKTGLPFAMLGGKEAVLGEK